MYKLSEKTKKLLSKNIGIPYEKLITMDNDEITAYIEQKNGKKMTFSKPDARFAGSGDDSVLIDKGRYRTMEDVDKRIDQVVKNSKCKKTKSKQIIKEDEEAFGI